MPDTDLAIPTASLLKEKRRRAKLAKSLVRSPVCVFCKQSGVPFAIFTPRFAPFGTACVDCESTLPEGTTVPAQ